MKSFKHFLESYRNPNDDIKGRDRLGRCYELAGRYATYNTSVTLIHGSIQGMGKPRIDHAWVELPDNKVWEPASNKIWPGEVFEAIFNPKTTDRYTFTQLNKMLVKHENWGPWN